jgi:hypothetical protein
MSSTHHPTRREEFLKEIDAAIENAPYKDNPGLHRLYCIGMLKELLLYSGVDMLEVREHVRELAQRQQDK